MFKTKIMKPDPNTEQETIISHDKHLDQWHIYTNNPTHARKYEHVVVAPGTKTYHIDSGVLIGLDAVVNGSASVRGKRTMSDEQKKAASDRLKNMRRRKKDSV